MRFLISAVGEALLPVAPRDVFQTLRAKDRVRGALGVPPAAVAALGYGHIVPAGRA